MHLKVVGSSFPAGLDNVTLGFAHMGDAQRGEYKEMLLVNKRTIASASLSADGYEEHSMDGAEPQKCKEVTQSLASLGQN